jgi:hypothetical protein
MSDRHAGPHATLRRTYEQLLVELEITTDTKRLGQLREWVSLLHHTLERLAPTNSNDLCGNPI